VYPEAYIGGLQIGTVTRGALGIAGGARYLTAEGYKLLARSNIDTYRQIRKEELKKK